MKEIQQTLERLNFLREKLFFQFDLFIVECEYVESIGGDEI